MQIEEFRLNQLLSIVGDKTFLSELIYVEQSTVYKWCRDKKVSFIGALLIENCNAFNKFVDYKGNRYFTADNMRPNIHPVKWERHKKNKLFLRSLKEIEYKQQKLKSLELSPNQIYLTSLDILNYSQKRHGYIRDKNNKIIRAQELKILIDGPKGVKKCSA